MMASPSKAAHLHVYPDLEALSQAAASLFAAKASQAIKARGAFYVALAGGATPGRTYELLSGDLYRQQVNWPLVHVFWGDERCVPPTDPRSNVRMAQEKFLKLVPIPENQIHPISCQPAPGEAAKSYEDLLRRFFAGKSHSFDWAFLGLGPDGHTASLFPGEPAVNERNRWVIAVFRGEEGIFRVTLTPAVLNRARTVVFLVSGRDKAQALQEVLEGEYEPQRLPAQAVRPEKGELLWLVDQAAAAVLDPDRPFVL